MSTFLGKIKHFPNISLDRFDGDNLNSEAFLLSHCHEDHMYGLRNRNFIGPLYLSPVSAVFVRKQFPHITKLVEIDVGDACQINTSQGSVIITAFPAYHCPGSIMFLLQNNAVNVIYTGDIRLNRSDLEKIAALKEYQNKLDEIHLDSTFLSEMYPNFPLQEESAQAISDLIKEWIDKGPKRKVILGTPAKYGYEWLFIQLQKTLNKQIYMDENVYKSYHYIPEMDKAITFDPKHSQIHACKKNGCSCGVFNDDDQIRTIFVSAMIWRYWNDTKPFKSQEPEKNLFRVCYSNHSSLTEIKDLILFFKPKQIFLNVIPMDDTKRNEMMRLLNEIRKTYASEEFTTEEPKISISFSNVARMGKRKSTTDLVGDRKTNIPSRNSLKRMSKEKTSLLK